MVAASCVERVGKVDAVYDNLDVLIVSVFCAGGLYAYVREAMRLDGLIRTGKTTTARILKTEIDDSGSESVKHYLVTYEFADEQGSIEVHEQDLDDATFFDSLKVGDTIEILHGADRSGNSYPLRVVRSGLRISRYVSLAIVAFWFAMTIYFLAFNR